MPRITHKGKNREDESKATTSGAEIRLSRARAKPKEVTPPNIVPIAPRTRRATVKRPVEVVSTPSTPKRRGQPKRAKKLFGTEDLLSNSDEREPDGLDDFFIQSPLAKMFNESKDMKFENTLMKDMEQHVEKTRDSLGAELLKPLEKQHLEPVKEESPPKATVSKRTRRTTMTSSSGFEERSTTVSTSPSAMHKTEKQLKNIRRCFTRYSCSSKGSINSSLALSDVSSVFSHPDSTLSRVNDPRLLLQNDLHAVVKEKRKGIERDGFSDSDVDGMD